MPDTMYQTRRALPVDAAHPEAVIDEITQVIRDLEIQAETRPFPVALDWSAIKVQVMPSVDLPSILNVTASAPVL